MRNQLERSHHHLSTKHGDHTDIRAIYNPVSLGNSHTNHHKLHHKSNQAPVVISRFPDEQQYSVPLRSKLQLNTFPLPPTFPSSHLTGSIASNKRVRQRRTNVKDSKLWGFSVQYSSQPIEQSFERAKAYETRLIEAQERLDQQARNAQEQRAHQDQQHKTEQEDYALYLYFVTKYGALDGILYCSSRFPGQVYANLVDKSARTLQHWCRQRMLAMRRYWIYYLARHVSCSSLQIGQSLVVSYQTKEHHAITFLKQLQSRHLRLIFNAWFWYLKRQQQIQKHRQRALQNKCFEAFYQWHQRIKQMLLFKQNLKQIAKKKQLMTSFLHWQQWQQHEEKVRLYLMHKWIELQRNVFKSWKEWCKRCQCEEYASRLIQCRWKGFYIRRWYHQQQDAIQKINRIGRGYLGRQQAADRKEQWMMIQLIEQMKNVVVYQEYCTSQVIPCRSKAIQQYYTRQEDEMKALDQAEQEAQILVQCELNKVVRNEQHIQLQEQIRILEEQESLRRKDKAHYYQQAISMLIDKQVQISRTKVLTTFAANQPAVIPHPLRKDLSLCAVCGADWILWLNSMRFMGLQDTCLAQDPICCCTSQHNEWLVRKEDHRLLKQLGEQDHQIIVKLLSDKIPFWRCVPYLSLVPVTRTSKRIKVISPLTPQEVIPCLPSSPEVVFTHENIPNDYICASNIVQTSREIILGKSEQEFIFQDDIRDPFNSGKQDSHLTALPEITPLDPDVINTMKELIELVDLIHQTEQEEESRLEYQDTLPYARGHRPESAKVRVLSAVIRVQSVFRGYVSRRAFRMALYQQALECGMLGAMPGTLQGKSGWYQDPQSLVVYYYEVNDDDWKPVIVLECDILILTSYQMEKMLLNHLLTEVEMS